MRGCRGLLGAVAVVLLWSAGALAGEPCRGWLPDLDADCDRPARFAGFTAPMSHAFAFEDPFINTGVSVWALWHQFPDSSVFAGGDARAVAVQLRLALTERLALIATKDGHFEVRPHLAILDDEKGHGDLGFGFKYALVHRPEDRLIVTPSLRYEMTQGDSDALQGNGEGVWIPAVSVGAGVGRAHVVGAVGARLPVDGDEESSILFYNAQLGFPLTPALRPFVGLNGLHYLDEGRGTTRLPTDLGELPIETVQTVLGTGRFEGVDVANLGSRGVEGHDYITWSAGLRLALTDRVDVGLVYERPLTRRRYITKQRVSLNILLEL